MLAQYLHHPAIWCQVIITGQDRPVEGAIRHLEHVLQPVGGGLVRPHDPEGVRVGADDVAQERAEYPGGLAGQRGGVLDLHGVVAEVGQRQRAEQFAAVGVRVGAHPARPFGHGLGDQGDRPPFGVEEFLGAVGAHPFFEHPQVVGVLPYP